VRFHWHRVVTRPRGAGPGRVTTRCNNQPKSLLPAAATTTAAATAVPSAVPAAAADRHDGGAGFDFADAVGVQANVGGHETLPLPVLGDSLFHSARPTRRGPGDFDHRAITPGGSRGGSHDGSHGGNRDGNPGGSRDGRSRGQRRSRSGFSARGRCWRPGSNWRSLEISLVVNG